MNTPHTNLSPIIDGQNRIRQQFKRFAQRWAETKEYWLDAKREQFEREHLQSLGPSLSRLSATMDEFRDFVVRSERELSDENFE